MNNPTTTRQLTAFLKWAGGKEQELKHILPLVPTFDTYYEPFVGGGAVLFSMQPHKKYINDKSTELFNLYTLIAQNKQDFFVSLDQLLLGWQTISRIVDTQALYLTKIYKAYSDGISSHKELADALLDFIQHHEKAFTGMFATFYNKDTDNFIRELQKNLLSKTRRMRELENKKWRLPERDIVRNIEGALKSGFYMHLRHLYNKIAEYQIAPGVAGALFFFVRENAYASMFRYNSRGEFNVPYGGLSYNRKDIAKKIEYIKSPILQCYLRDAVIENLDFEAFLLQYPPQKNDFIFLDPPYDSEFSTYAQNEFSMEDQERLAHYLLDRCEAKFMLIIKNTPAILALYSHPKVQVKMFNKKYLVSFQNRNDKDVEHLVVMNY